MSTGDAVVEPFFSLERPRWRFGLDWEPDEAVASRLAFLEQAAGERVRVFGFHMPCPGFGRVARAGRRLPLDPGEVGLGALAAHGRAIGGEVRTCGRGATDQLGTWRFTSAHRGRLRTVIATALPASAQLSDAARLQKTPMSGHGTERPTA